MEAVLEIQEVLRTSGRITVLTGAGISAESGIATFRGDGGLWDKYKIEDVATPEAFKRNPELVLEFYNMRRRQLLNVKPNPAHFALARLEEAVRDRLTLITQNVDDLHERAGSNRVLHMHGELTQARCTSCSQVVPWTGDISVTDRCESCGEALRPHIVWFGEVPFHLETEIPQALEAEIFMAVGTSGSVYPAAGMVLEAKLRQKLTIEVNLEASENTPFFDHHLRGPAGVVLPEFIDACLATHK